MNRRLIAKILKAKHAEWCASIKDERVQELAKKHSIITGGSIVSLLIGERVKDYDIYFRDKETVEAVAQYYVAQFNELNPDHKVKPSVWVQGDRVRIRIQSAGITSEESDQDYAYFEQREAGEGQDYVEKMTESLDDVNVRENDNDGDKPAYRPVFLSDNAVTLSNHVQLVVRFYGNPEDIHKNYDFIHCTNYWTSDDGQLTLRPQALESIITKELHYVGSLYPVCSVIRTRKFLKRGWHINAGQFLKMCFQISELDLNNLEVLQEQLTGVDAAYFYEIIEYCKKRQGDDPDFKVTMPYLCTIIDRVFGACGGGE